MTVSTKGDTTVLTCGQCNRASMSIRRRELSAAEWMDSKGWKELRRRAYAASWRISASENGDHYCPACIAVYDF